MLDTPFSASPDRARTRKYLAKAFSQEVKARVSSSIPTNGLLSDCGQGELWLCTSGSLGVIGWESVLPSSRFGVWITVGDVNLRIRSVIWGWTHSLLLEEDWRHPIAFNQQDSHIKWHQGTESLWWAITLSLLSVNATSPIPHPCFSPTQDNPVSRVKKTLYISTTGIFENWDLSAFTLSSWPNTPGTMDSGNQAPSGAAPTILILSPRIPQLLQIRALLHTPWRLLLTVAMKLLWQEVLVRRSPRHCKPPSLSQPGSPEPCISLSSRACSPPLAPSIRTISAPFFCTPLPLFLLWPHPLFPLYPPSSSPCFFSLTHFSSHLRPSLHLSSHPSSPLTYFPRQLSPGNKHSSSSQPASPAILACETF